MLAEGRLKSAKLSGYYEADFLSAGVTSNNNQSNSYTMRQRQAWGQAALDNGCSTWAVYAHLAVAYALMGQQEQAEAAVAQARESNPKLTIKWFRERLDDPSVIFEGLRKAGLAEE